jgi:hypothetical protein
MEDVFSAKARYACQTDIRAKTIQSVVCKTIEIESDSHSKSAGKKDSSDDSESSEEEEISSKLVSIQQELKLQTSTAVQVDESRCHRYV